MPQLYQHVSIPEATSGNIRQPGDSLSWGMYRTVLPFPWWVIAVTVSMKFWTWEVNSYKACVQPFEACAPKGINETTKTNKQKTINSQCHSGYSDLFYPVLNLKGLSLTFHKQSSSFRTLSGQPWSASATLISAGATNAQQQTLISGEST